MSAPKAHVLAIDDEPGIRDMLASLLVMEGYDVATAESGSDAVAVAQQQRFDVVITDYSMPGMDGLETLRALKAIDPELAVIIATGYASEDTLRSCRAGGAYDTIRKPYEVDDLLQAIERALEQKATAPR
jgi:DNA-binding NtrC family response regulator